jgi:hypothetical protein
MADRREQDLVKRVQRLQRQRNRVRYLPVTQKNREKRARELDRKIVQARAELALFRSRKLPEDRRLCQQILDHRNTRCENYRSPFDGMTAGDALRQMVKDGRTWNKQSGKFVTLNVTMLRVIVRIADAAAKRGEVVALNCLSTGSHSFGGAYPSGQHPLGNGVDFAKQAGAVSGEVIARETTAAGGYYLNEDATHHHCSFRR